MKLKILDLFSGLGGFSLGLERTGCFKTIAFCDNNKFSKLILDKHWKGIKIYDDIREITKEKFKTDGIESPDIITGGFPCQPFSVAGKQKGTSDDRHLWPEMFRIIKAFKPRFVIGENVRGIINIQDGVVFETVCTDLESEGYEVQPFIIPASGVGAPHRRERVWIIAHREYVANTISNDERREISRSDEETRGIQKEHRTENSTTRKFSRTSEIRKSDNGYEDVSNTESERTRQNNEGLWSRTSGISGGQRASGQDVENSRRTLRQGTELGAANEDEVGKENANQHQRSSSSSESNVADTNKTFISTEIRNLSETNGEIKEGGQTYGRSSKFSTGSVESRTEDVANTDTRLGNGENQEIQTGRNTSNTSSEDVADTESISSDVGGREEHQEERDGQRKIRGEGSEDASNTDRTRLQRLGSEHELRNSEEEKQTRRIGWWDIEPNVGRVAHGVSGRVHRLKGLGNSIVPQIAEEIGRAIIKAMK